MSRGLYSDPFLKALLEKEPKLAKEFLQEISNTEYVGEPEIVSCLEMPDWAVEKAGIKGFMNPNFPPKEYEKFHGRTSIEYYQRALEVISRAGGTLPLVIFTDNKTYAAEIIKSIPNISLILGPEDVPNQAENLMLMTLGKNFIGANSSYSWWAAFLRKNEHAEVIAPTPWFSGMPEPVDLIPNNWQRINSGFASGFE
jgi:hypothetical protein